MVSSATASSTTAAAAAFSGRASALSTGGAAVAQVAPSSSAAAPAAGSTASVTPPVQAAAACAVGTGAISQAARSTGAISQAARSGVSVGTVATSSVAPGPLSGVPLSVAVPAASTSASASVHIGPSLVAGEKEAMTKFEPGDHVVQRGWIYDHHGLYTIDDNGDPVVIHHPGTDSRPGSPRYAVVEERMDPSQWTFRERIAGGKNKIDEVIRRARNDIGKTEYSFFFRNCEHYVNFWKTGNWVSWQVRLRAVLIAAIPVATAVAIMFGVGATAPTFLGSRWLGWALAELGLIEAGTSFCWWACLQVGGCAGAAWEMISGSCDEVARRFREAAAKKIRDYTHTMQALLRDIHRQVATVVDAVVRASAERNADMMQTVLQTLRDYGMEQPVTLLVRKRFIDLLSKYLQALKTGDRAMEDVVAEGRENLEAFVREAEVAVQMESGEDMVAYNNLQTEFRTLKHRLQHERRANGGPRDEASSATATCSICWDRQIDRVMLCGHTCCSECYKRLPRDSAGRSSECHMCRRKTSDSECRVLYLN